MRSLDPSTYSNTNSQILIVNARRKNKRKVGNFVTAKSNCMILNTRSFNAALQTLKFIPLFDSSAASSSIEKKMAMEIGEEADSEDDEDTKMLMVKQTIRPSD